MINNEMMNNTDTLKHIEKVMGPVFKALRPLFDEDRDACMEATMYLITKVREAATIAEDLPDPEKDPQGHAQGKAQAMQILWSLISDEEL